MEYRRNLPNFQPDGALLFITFRLYGTLPLSPDGEFCRLDQRKNRDRRGASRALASGHVEISFDNPVPAMIEAEMVESSATGFRAAHDSRSLEPGLDVRYRAASASGRARVMWTHVQYGRLDQIALSRLPTYSSGGAPGERRVRIFRIGGWPKNRLYSRLNWLALSYPTSKAALAASRPSMSMRPRAACNRSCF